MISLFGKQFHYAWLVLIGCCFMQAGGLGAVLDAAGVFFVPVCDSLGFTRSEISLYLTFYFIATVVAMPVVGQWITKFNINKLLSIAFILVALAVAAMGFYSEPWQWWASGLVFGLAGSFIFIVPAPILIGNWFHTHKGIALGAAMSFSGIGGAALSPLFTIFIQDFGWREAYVLAAIVMAVLVLPWTLFVFKLHPQDIDLKPYGWEKVESEITEFGSGPADEFGGVTARRALRTLPFWCMFLFSGLIAYFAGFNAHLPGFAASVGFDPLVGSSLLSAVMVGNVVEKYVVGYLNDRIGVQVTVNIQLVMVALGLLGFAFAGNNLIMLYISSFLFGAQNSLVSVSTPLLVRQIFGGKDYAKIYSYARIGTGVIGCLGPITVAGMFDATGSFVPAFMLGVAIVVAAFACERIAYLFRKTVCEK